MNEDGGGTAHLGRLIGASLRRHCARHRLAFRGLHLPPLDGSVATDGYAAYGGSRARLTAALVFRLVLSRLALSHRQTAIYFDHVGPARALALVPRALLPRYAIQLHGIEIWRQLSRDRQQVLENATFLVANSAYTAERAREYLPAKYRMRIVLLGIEPVVLVGSVDRNVLAEAGEGYALIVGRTAGMDRYKGHDELLEIWPEVRRRLLAARLVVAGSGSDLERLRGKAAALGLTADSSDAAVYFTGQIDPATLGELYRRAAIFAMPSLLEGFGLVYPEAMAAGKPCLALQRTAPAEIIVDGETGRLVPQNDPAALGDALVELLGNPERARAMGEAGRRRYEREFTARAFERRFQPVVDELVGG